MKRVPPALSLALAMLAHANAIPQTTTPQQPTRQQQTTPAQATPARTDEDVVRVETNLVQVDAVVLDREGRQVTDLRPEEFEILEAGRP